MKTKNQIVLTAFVSLAALHFQPSTAFAQGSLTPPGAPAPTFKTLQQVEPRTPISSAPFTISVPGSYYLTTNLTTASGNAVVIAADNVVLDLNGFSIDAGTGGDGIAASTPRRNLVVRNGTIVSCGSDGIQLSQVSGGQASDLIIASNAATGLTVGNHWLIRNCTVLSNGAGGIILGDGCRLSDSLSASNALFGIGTGTHCSIEHSTAANNAGDGITINFNGLVSDCLVHQNRMDGIRATNATVRLCRVSSNSTNGIFAVQGSVVTDNFCTGNGGGAAGGAGVRILFGQNRIEGNHIVGSAFGIFVDSGATANLIIRNSATGCSTNYAIPTQNTYGPTNLVNGVILTNNALSNFGIN